MYFIILLKLYCGEHTDGPPPPDIIIPWFILQGTPDLSHATFETLGTGVCLIEK